MSHTRDKRPSLVAKQQRVADVTVERVPTDQQRAFVDQSVDRKRQRSLARQQAQVPRPPGGQARRATALNCSSWTMLFFLYLSNWNSVPIDRRLRYQSRRQVMK
jgi:hypothetical protein